MKRAVALVAILAFTSPAESLGYSPGMVFYTSKNCPKLVGNDTADDTAALNSCLAAVPWNATLVLNGTYKVTSTINFTAKVNSTLSCGLGRGSYQGCGLHWAGANDVGPVLNLDGVNRVKIQGLQVQTDAVSGNVAKWGIALRNSGVGGVTTTSVVFEDVAVSNVRNYTFTPADYVGIMINPDSSNNIEHITFERGAIICSTGATPAQTVGTGIEGGHNFNQKGNLHFGQEISYCGIAIDQAESITAMHMELAGNGIDFRLNANNGVPIDYCHISDVDAENGTVFFQGGNCTIEHVRIGAFNPTAADAIFEINTGNDYTRIADAHVYDSPAGTKGIYCYGTDGGGGTGHGAAYTSSGSKLVLEGNHGLLCMDANCNQGVQAASAATIIDEDLHACSYFTSSAEVWGSFSGTGQGVVIGGIRTGGYNPVTLGVNGSQLPGMASGSTVVNSGMFGATTLVHDIGAATYNQQKLLICENGRPCEPVRPGPTGHDPSCTTDDDIGKIWPSTAATTVFKRCAKVSGVIQWVTF